MLSITECITEGEKLDKVKKHLKKHKKKYIAGAAAIGAAAVTPRLMIKKHQKKMGKTLNDETLSKYDRYNKLIHHSDKAREWRRYDIFEKPSIRRVARRSVKFKKQYDKQKQETLEKKKNAYLKKNTADNFWKGMKEKYPGMEIKRGPNVRSDYYKELERIRKKNK